MIPLFLVYINIYILHGSLAHNFAGHGTLYCNTQCAFLCHPLLVCVNKCENMGNSLTKLPRLGPPLALSLVASS